MSPCRTQSHKIERLRHYPSSARRSLRKIELRRVSNCANEKRKSLNSAQVKSIVHCRRNVGNYHADAFILPRHKEPNLTSACEDKESHECPFCENIFSRKHDKNRHVAAVHEKQKPHKCTQCETRFTSKRHVAKRRRSQGAHVVLQTFRREQHLYSHIHRGFRRCLTCQRWRRLCFSLRYSVIIWPASAYMYFESGH